MICDLQISGQLHAVAMFDSDPPMFGQRAGLPLFKTVKENCLLSILHSFF